jgi:hypothetical protein
MAKPAIGKTNSQLRPSDAVPMLCEMECEAWATHDCYPQMIPGVWGLQRPISLCRDHAREADPTLREGGDDNIG